MATNKEININGVMTPVTEFSHTAQEIDDATTRALEGGAIDQLLAGKAPAGYGLGDYMGLVITSNTPGGLNAATKCGWYYFGGNSPIENVPTGVSQSNYGYLLVCSRTSNGSLTQFAFFEVHDNIAIRHRSGTTWGPWEWVNPPMNLGVEYRTTERYQGKPVYVKLANFGALPNATLKSLDHGIQDMSVPFSIEGHITNGSRTAVSSSDISWSCTSSKLIATTTTDMSTRNAYVKIKYTKTTD